MRIVRYLKKYIKKMLMYRVYFSKDKFRRIGQNTCLPLRISYSNGSNIYIGDNVSLGSNVNLMAKNATITIRSHVVSSKNLIIVTGDHERRVGFFCSNIDESSKNKNLHLDLPVEVQEDVWLGINVTILKGVTIGRGATVCAGAVVTKNIPPYSICGGVPAKFIKFYWNIPQILAHEANLYPEDERIPEEILTELFKAYN